MNDQEATEDADVLERLAALRLEHQALDAEVAELASKAQPDQIHMARLKKRKLYMKDMIARLEDQLTPDIIA
jgi:hypothetical protein